MIVAFLLILFSGTSDSALLGIFDEVEEKIEATVLDKHARKDLLETTGAAKKLAGDYEKKRQILFNELIKLGKRREASAAEYQQLYDSLNEAEKSFQAGMIGHHFILRQQLTHDTWEQFFPPSNPSGEKK